MKRRILHVSHLSGLHGGAEQALRRLMESRDRTRFDSMVVLPADGPLRAALAGIGVPTFVSPIAWWIPATHWSASEFNSQLQGLETRWQALAELAAREQVDLIHSNTLVTIEGELAATALGIPHVWHSRGPFARDSSGDGFPPKYAGGYEFFYSVVDEVGDQVVCVSKCVLDQTMQYVRKTPCTVIADGFDLREPPASGDFDPAVELGISEPATFIACIGGIQWRKGQLDLIDAFALVRREHPEVVLLLCGVIGDAQYAEQVRARVEVLGLGSCVKILGFRDDVASVIRRCRLVVHAAKSEGFGLAVLEAMAAGKPVVATRSGGPEEIIEDGVSGVLVNPSAPEELARAICALLSNADRADAMGVAAGERAKLFTASASAERLQDLFSRMIDTAPLKSPDPGRANAVCASVLRRYR